ncbi:MAG: hypothetical protein C1943_17865 [Halochromatium sp.]|nr:hypothetical protein [Halochromatium sp.]
MTTRTLVEHYQVFGLHVASEIPCPELLGPEVDLENGFRKAPPCPEQPGSEPASNLAGDPARSARSAPSPDCHWRLARLEPALEPASDHASVANDQFQIAPGLYQFLIKDVARYRVQDGREILVDPLPDADPGDVRLWLLGTALGALLHQRGLLPLHVSALALSGGAYAFCGDSGAGKSTLAAALHRRGLALLTDDVGLAVPESPPAPSDQLGDHQPSNQPSNQPSDQPNDQRSALFNATLSPGAAREPQMLPVRFYPGFPRIKLWRDALDHFGLDHRPLIRDLTRTDKFHLRLDAHDGFQAHPLPLRRLYLLERGAEDDAVRIEPVRGHEAISLIQTHTYRPGLVRRMGRAGDHLRQCGRVASRIQVFRLQRPWRLDRLDETVDQLLSHMSQS